MKLNEIKPNKKSINKIKRLGRGMGSGKGKTCGKGHKGQKARSGYKAKHHFEGGQMPKQRRLPKTGFTSAKEKYRKTIRLSELNKIKSDLIDLNSLKKYKLINGKYKYIKIISSGEIENIINIQGIKVSNGARLKIEKNGGKII